MLTRSEANGRLIPDGEGESVPLLKSRLKLGRKESCDISFRFPEVPSQLCRLTWERGLWKARALAEYSGFMVNGRQTTECWLYPGDVIQIGARRYTIDYATRIEGGPGENC